MRNRWLSSHEVATLSFLHGSAVYQMLSLRTYGRLEKTWCRRLRKVPSENTRGKTKVAAHLSRGNCSNAFHHPVPLHPPDPISPCHATPFRIDIHEPGPCDRRHGVSVPKRSSPEQLYGGTGQHYLHQWPGGRRRHHLTGHNVHRSSSNSTAISQRGNLHPQIVLMKM